MAGTLRADWSPGEVQYSARRQVHSGRFADRDRHAHEGAEAPVVVADLDLPDPGGATAVAPARDGVDRAVEDRAQERGLVGESLRAAALAAHRVPRPHRRDRLRDRGEDAAVHEARRLPELGAHGYPRRDLLVGDGEHLEAVEAVEAPQPGPWQSRRLGHARAL